MTNWFKQNAWALIIAAATVISNLAVTDYRLSEYERKGEELSTRLSVLENKDIDRIIALTQMQKDIEYIKLQITKFVEDRYR